MFYINKKFTPSFWGFIHYYTGFPSFLLITFKNYNFQICNLYCFFWSRLKNEWLTLVFAWCKRWKLNKGVKISILKTWINHIFVRLKIKTSKLIRKLLNQFTSAIWKIRQMFIHNGRWWKEASKNNWLSDCNKVVKR